MPTDVMGVPFAVAASVSPVSGLRPTAMDAISSRFVPELVTECTHVRVEPLVTPIPVGPGPTASTATNTAGGSVVIIESVTVAVWVRVPLTPVIVSVYVPIGVAAVVVTVNVDEAD